MPGPIAVTNPFTGLLQNLTASIRQHRHPVYNAQGRKVGSYETLDALCAGKWFLFTGETAPPRSQLYVMDFWGRRVPLSVQCVEAAKATARGGLATIVQPQPVTAASAAKAVADANTAATGSPDPIDPSTLIPYDPVPPQSGASRLMLYGVGGLLALAVVVRLARD